MADVQVPAGATQPSEDWQLVLMRVQDGQPRLNGAVSTPLPPPPEMNTGPRVAIGVALGLLCAVMLAHLLWVWSFAARLVPGNVSDPTPHIRVHWLGLAFTPTMEWALVLLVIFAAAAG